MRPGGKPDSLSPDGQIIPALHPGAAVILGAAIHNDGSPSGALKRRVSAALTLQTKYPNLMYLVTGGVGKGKPISEAAVMRQLLLDGGILDQYIIMDEASMDTMDSIVYCSQLLRHRQINNIIICTDTYHLARTKLLFNLFGISTTPYPMPSGRNSNGWLRWIYYYIREAAAIVWDLFIGLYRKYKMPNDAIDR